MALLYVTEAACSADSLRLVKHHGFDEKKDIYYLYISFFFFFFYAVREGEREGVERGGVGAEREGVEGGGVGVYESV